MRASNFKFTMPVRFGIQATMLLSILLNEVNDALAAITMGRFSGVLVTAALLPFFEQLLIHPECDPNFVRIARVDHDGQSCPTPSPLGQGFKTWANCHS